MYFLYKKKRKEGGESKKSRETDCYWRAKKKGRLLSEGQEKKQISIGGPRIKGRLLFEGQGKKADCLILELGGLRKKADCYWRAKKKGRLLLEGQEKKANCY